MNKEHAKRKISLKRIKEGRLLDFCGDDSKVAPEVPDKTVTVPSGPNITITSGGKQTIMWEQRGSEGHKQHPCDWYVFGRLVFNHKIHHQGSEVRLDLTLKWLEKR